MTDARWQQVKALFQATVDRPASERAAFLAAAVGGDEELRREIESLLNADSSDPGFTDRLPFRDQSRTPDSLAGALPSGEATRTGPPVIGAAGVGQYRVIGLLGVGGMGEVFRARDSKLNRDVALKVLPSAFEFDPDRLARFRREAQMLAALNHPNIAAIYGLEESNGRQALVLELVEGVTLAKRIEDGPLPFVEALTIGASDSRGAPGRPREGHRSSRSQAGQYQGHTRRCRESARLRVGEDCCRRCAADRARSSHRPWLATRESASFSGPRRT